MFITYSETCVSNTLNPSNMNALFPFSAPFLVRVLGTSYVKMFAMHYVEKYYLSCILELEH